MLLMVTINTCHFKHVTEHPDVKCPSCRHLVKEAVGGKRKLITGGYVKDVVTYMVMDNLVVKPMSTISTITLINNFVVNDLSQLEEKTLTFGKDEVIYINFQILFQYYSYFNVIFFV